MSYRECVSVARTVFGANNEAMCKNFLAVISPQMVGQKNDGATTGSTDTRRIDITQFLHLAVVGYHQTRPSEEGGGFDMGESGDDSGEGGSYRAVPYPGQVVPPVPSPSPSLGAYMSRYAPRTDGMDDSSTPSQQYSEKRNARGYNTQQNQQQFSNYYIDDNFTHDHEVDMNAESSAFEGYPAGPNNDSLAGRYKSFIRMLY
jgi:hypothetical protein